MTRNCRTCGHEVFGAAIHFIQGSAYCPMCCPGRSQGDEKLRTERDALKAEVERLRTGLGVAWHEHNKAVEQCNVALAERDTARARAGSLEATLCLIFVNLDERDPEAAIKGRAISDAALKAIDEGK